VKGLRASAIALACLLAPLAALAQDAAAPVAPPPAQSNLAPVPPAQSAPPPQTGASATPVVASPPPSRQRPDPATDEGGIWGIADRAERDARNSGELNRDPALNAYVRDVACRVAAEFCGDIRLYLMDRPFFNASMAPNGYMEVWSGLLLRVDDEAQLAFVLGHEITHYAERHSLDALRALRARANTAMALSVVLAVAGAAAAGNNPNSAQSIMDATQGLINITYLGAIASFFGFTRENEMEADSVGFDRAVAAGYAPDAGAALWTYLIAETQKSQFETVRRRATRGSLFATHPVNSERVAALQAKLAGRSGGATRADRHRAAIRPHLGAWLRDDLRRRDFDQSLFLIERLARRGEDLGMLDFYRGEVYRQRRRDGDLALSEAAYSSAVGHADAPPEAWRALGEIHARAGRNAEARAAFTTYLERAPNAQDRLIIERRIASIPGG
jgi:Zn-dependent protease with chaperone function